MPKSEYCQYILDILAPVGGITAKAMFGGYGLYKDGIIFGIMADEMLYFKVDDRNRPRYEACGSEPFSYQTKDEKKVVMSYWQVPLDILEDAEQLAEWVVASVAVSKLAGAKKKKKARSG